LFVFHVVYEHGELWWSDIDMRKLLLHPPELFVNATSSHLLAKLEELAKEIMDLGLRSIFVHTLKGFLTCRKILRLGADGFTSPPYEGLLPIFIALKNPSPPGRV
jgi:hypothetical protein